MTTNVTNSQVKSGNSHFVYMDGVKIGFARSVTVRVDFALEGQYGIGGIDPLENTPTRADYSIDVSEITLKKGSLSDLGVVAQNGTDALQGRVIDIITQDSNGVVLRRCVGCSNGGGETKVEANHVIITDSHFKALNVFNS